MNVFLFRGKKVGGGEGEGFLCDQEDDAFLLDSIP